MKSKRRRQKFCGTQKLSPMSPTVFSQRARLPALRAGIHLESGKFYERRLFDVNARFRACAGNFTDFINLRNVFDDVNCCDKVNSKNFLTTETRRSHRERRRNCRIYLSLRIISVTSPCLCGEIFKLRLVDD